MTSKTILKHSKLIGASDSGPKIIRDQYSDVFFKFLDTQTAQEIKSLFIKTYEQYIQILFVSVMLNRTSNPFVQGKQYEPSLFSIDCMQELSYYFTKAFKQEFKRKRLDIFNFTDRYVNVSSKSKSALLNSLVFPKIIIIQHLHKHDMDRTLNALKGYMYRDFPREFTIPKVKPALDTLHASPIYQWYFYGEYSGFKVYMKRVTSDILAMRVEFDMPHILPLGKFTESSMIALLKRQIQTFSFGV